MRIGNDTPNECQDDDTGDAVHIPKNRNNHSIKRRFSDLVGYVAVIFQEFTCIKEQLHCTSIPSRRKKLLLHSL